MAYHLTEEQRMIQTMVRDFARDVIMPGAAERDKTKEFPMEIIKSMGELGLMGMNVPTEYNGAGVDTVSYSVAMQEIAYADASVAVVMSVHNSVACGPIYLFGSDYLKEHYLKRLTTGELIGSFAITEPGAGSDPAGQRTRAARDGDSYVLNGNKIFISTGKNSNITVVTAYTDRDRKHKGISAFVVEKGTPGFYVGKQEEKMGLLASDTVELIFEDCRVPAENLLGQEGDGFTVAMTSLDGGRIGIASQSVGLSQACLDAAICYARERVQFNKPIAQFQGISWMIADMATQVEAARLLTFNAAAMKDRGENFTAAASMAKLFASETANQVAYKALQIHGGYGYTKDFPIERYYRDARVFTIYEGTSEIQRTVIAKRYL
ncbi:MAG: acyl-CoA dehydrogenase [Deltaproteobacteria bacterium CG23_combo_of_CG06-09_8_20_14_all_51_20]|nr:acyl-CoA dehydrogenase [bacterium]NCP07658.1 acyl-CoA dehydrogenase [bacterium]OIP40013.1 MAG: acyl-CoA dehydrogenase [Desulfobacteraceae bacterium CG2_30_51_40]PIP45130.1 MAG: acyl-CoA dehydrogenase [Deltaproteobacteria bacterium CG23_combo_of_CG06-09_8_20_14_all_51_20]PJB33424.1 MAG: acyl-CoA dehydrogenase [Deltaproteobacteria bacterium CG_4_9_14_3_um_filter_51_14]